MSIKIKQGLCVLLIILCSCGKPVIDEKYVAKIVQKELAIQGNVIAHKLSGGFSGTMNFIVANGEKKYVVRFIQNKGRREPEIHNFNIASHEGYGPCVYYADQSRGIVIMEYLSGTTISSNDLQSDQLYVALANLLRKIHRGQEFKSQGFDVFNRITDDLRIDKPKYSKYVPLAQIEHIISVIHAALLPHLIATTPCHNDLQGRNLIFLGNEFKAIDYGDAGPGDPYFDVATVIAGSSHGNPAQEKILFSTYLGSQPSASQEAKLYLMKQVVFIKWALLCLDMLNQENVQRYELIKAPSSKDLLKEYFEGKLDLRKPENSLKLLKALINEVFYNFESQEFNNAVSLLGEVR